MATHHRTTGLLIAATILLAGCANPLSGLGDSRSRTVLETVEAPDYPQFSGTQPGEQSGHWGTHLAIVRVITHQDDGTAGSQGDCLQPRFSVDVEEDRLEVYDDHPEADDPRFLEDVAILTEGYHVGADCLYETDIISQEYGGPAWHFVLLEGPGFSLDVREDGSIEDKDDVLQPGEMWRGEFRFEDDNAEPEEARTGRGTVTVAFQGWIPNENVYFGPRR